MRAEARSQKKDWNFGSFAIRFWASGLVITQMRVSKKCGAIGREATGKPVSE